MERELSLLIRQKITDALAAAVPAHTRREVHLPGIKGKVMAVISMRRSDKPPFLCHELTVTRGRKRVLLPN